MEDLKSLNMVTKVLIVIFAGIVVYTAFSLVLQPKTSGTLQQMQMMQMMSQMMGAANTTNLITLLIAVGIAVMLSYYLFKPTETNDNQYEILRKALSSDERKVLDEVKKAEEITQDSLRFRLDWSKAKISTILTNLDKRGLIQRERTGKTYTVRLQKQ